MKLVFIKTDAQGFFCGWCRNQVCIQHKPLKCKTVPLWLQNQTTCVLILVFEGLSCKSLQIHIVQRSWARIPIMPQPSVPGSSRELNWPCSLAEKDGIHFLLPTTVTIANCQGFMSSWIRERADGTMSSSSTRCSWESHVSLSKLGRKWKEKSFCLKQKSLYAIYTTAIFRFANSTVMPR